MKSESDHIVPFVQQTQSKIMKKNTWVYDRDNPKRASQTTGPFVHCCTDARSSGWKELRLHLRSLTPRRMLCISYCTTRIMSKGARIRHSSAVLD